MKRLIFYFGLLATGFMLESCNEEETAQPLVNLRFTSDNTVSSIPSGRTSSNSLQFNSGYITLRQVQFEAETEDTDSVEVNLEQVIVIDFATGQTNPDLSSFVFPIGTYSEVRIELELQDVNDVPSVVIEGTFTDSQDEAHPIRFEFNSGETFEVLRSGSITFGEGVSVLAEVTFDPAVWFLGITSAQLEIAAKTDGVIVISENSNSDIFDLVADGLDLATEVEISL